MSNDDSLGEHPISSSAISVVIQGPLLRKHKEGDLASRAIESIRRHLPQAEILISTWPNQDVAGLNVDHILFSKEPPSFIDINGNVNNISKQIVSTRRGIEAASRPYVLKFRADHALLGPEIAVIRNYPTALPPKQPLFGKPITLTNLFIRNPLKVPMLFHLSDLVQFGCKKDMLDLWSIRLPDEKDIYLKKIPRLRILGQFIGYTAMRRVPEQFLMLACLEKHGYTIDLPEICHTRYRLFRLWEQILTDNFLVMDWQRSGIEFPPRFHSMSYPKTTIYTEKDIAFIRSKLTSRYYALHYLKLLLNQYVLCWFNQNYLHSFTSNILFSLSPKLAYRIRSIYRSLCKLRE